MRQTRIVTLLCLIASIANAQQNMRGSDTLALYTRGLITDLGLGSQLNYLGGAPAWALLMRPTPEPPAKQ